jgi:hypothetical protein
MSGSGRTVCIAQSGVVRHAAAVGSALISWLESQPFSLYMMAVLSLGSSVLRCEGNAESKLNNKHELEVDCTYSY